MNIEDKALNIILDHTSSSKWKQVRKLKWNTSEVQELLVKSLELRQVSKNVYDEIKAKKPEERVDDFGDVITNRIMGILVAYSIKYDMREGWVDIITINDAEKEIKQLIRDCNGDLNAL